MDNRTYDRLKNRDVQGRKALLLEETANGYASLPMGAEVTIMRKNNGYEIQSDPCGRCGIRATISHVPPQKLDLIPQQEGGPAKAESHAFIITVSPAQVSITRALLAQVGVNLNPHDDQVAPDAASSILQGANLEILLNAVRSFLQQRGLSPTPRAYDQGWSLQEERLALALAQGWFTWSDDIAAVQEARWGDGEDDFQWDEIAELYEPIMEKAEPNP